MNLVDLLQSKFTLLLYAQRFYEIFAQVWLEGELTLIEAKVPENITSHELVFLANSSLLVLCYKHFLLLINKESMSSENVAYHAH